MSDKAEERNISIAGRPLVLRCYCNLPWCRIENGCIIIKSRHHGETHQNVMPLATLLEMAQAQKQGRRE